MAASVSEQTEGLRLGESGAQPSVIACGDASSLSGSIKKFGELAKVSIWQEVNISPERGGGCERSEQTEGLRILVDI